MLRAIFVSGAAGILFSGSYIMLLDASAYSQLLREGDAARLIEPVLDQPPFRWTYVLPAIFGTFLVVLLNMASAADLYGGHPHPVRKNCRDLGYFLTGAFVIAGYTIPLYLHHLAQVYLSTVVLTLAGGTCIICSVMVFIRFSAS